MSSKTPLSKNSGWLTPTESILNAFIPLTVPSTFVNTVPGLATYQRLSKATAFMFVMVTMTFGIEPLSVAAQAVGAELMTPLEPICSPTGNGGALPSSSTVLGTASTSQVGVSAPLTAIGTAEAWNETNAINPSGAACRERKRIGAPLPIDLAAQPASGRRGKGANRKSA